jgi:hypothetical protein
VILFLIVDFFICRGELKRLLSDSMTWGSKFEVRSSNASVLYFTNCSSIDAYDKPFELLCVGDRCGVSEAIGDQTVPQNGAKPNNVSVIDSSAQFR